VVLLNPFGRCKGVNPKADKSAWSAQIVKEEMVQAFGRFERHPMADVINTFVSPTSFAELSGINHLLLSQIPITGMVTPAMSEESIRAMLAR
jgi:hypothetical protein